MERCGIKEWKLKILINVVCVSRFLIDPISEELAAKPFYLSHEAGKIKKIYRFTGEKNEQIKNDYCITDCTAADTGADFHFCDYRLCIIRENTCGHDQLAG